MDEEDLHLLRERRMDAFFRTFPTARELELPMADFECSGCGQIDRHNAGCPNQDSMEVALMEAVRTVMCKTAGCAELAPQFGRYAGRCPAHRENGNGNGSVEPSRFATALAESTSPSDLPPELRQIEHIEDDLTAATLNAIAEHVEATAESQLVQAARDVDAALLALAQAKAQLFRLVDESK